MVNVEGSKHSTSSLTVDPSYSDATFAERYRKSRRQIILSTSRLQDRGCAEPVD